MRDTEQPTAAQIEVLEALVHHEHLLVLQEGNGVIPRLCCQLPTFFILETLGV